MRAATALLVTAAAFASVPARAGPVPLTSEAKVRELCLGLRPAERMGFKDAEKREAFERRRQELASTDYFLELPWGAFRVSDWDQDAGEVTLSTERPFRVLGGALTVFDADRSEIVFRAVKGQDGALRTALNKGTASLALVLRPAEADDAPCTVSGAPAYTLLSDFMSAELRVGKVTVARAEEDGFVAMGVTEGKPTVEVTSAGEGETAPELLGAIAKLKPELEKCYATGLGRNPALDGSLVLGIETAKDGRLQASNVLADTLHDGELESCVKQTVATAKAPANAARGMVAIHLSRME